MQSNYSVVYNFSPFLFLFSRIWLKTILANMIEKKITGKTAVQFLNLTNPLEIKHVNDDFPNLCPLYQSLAVYGPLQ